MADTRTFLDRHGVTQTELACALGVDGSTVSRKLGGARGWKGTEIDAVLAFLSRKLGRPVTYEEAFGAPEEESDVVVTRRPAPEAA